MPAPYTADDTGEVVAYWSDCLTQLRVMADCSVHAVITDPPYGLADHKPEAVAQAITAWASGDRERVPTGKGGFMGRDWDSFVPPPAVWDECLRVLKPGGHLAVFAGSRTADLMGFSIRLAGFEMRDGIAAWVYGSGFPKSRDVSKDLDRIAGAQREIVGPGKYAARRVGPTTMGGVGLYRWGDQFYTWDELPENARQYRTEGSVASGQDTAPATDAAREWQGWGTALKPAHEPILLARKPLDGTVAGNVLAHGAGGINIDACRVATSAIDDIHAKNPHTQGGFGHANASVYGTGVLAEKYDSGAGRWPSNVVLAHHPSCGPDGAPGPCVDGCQVRALDAQSGIQRDWVAVNRNRSADTMSSWYGTRASQAGPDVGYGGGGGASRYFPTFRYCAKAPKRERPIVDGRGHPTVKPLGLCRWLARLLTPLGGTILDPFAGSGSTLEAAQLEGFRAIGIEADEHSCQLIAERLARSTPAEEPPALFA